MDIGCLICYFYMYFRVEKSFKGKQFNGTICIVFLKLSEFRVLEIALERLNQIDNVLNLLQPSEN